jgi:hypothetical protein
MAKAEIGWVRRTAEGEKCGQWRFYARARRYDRWQLVAHPPLEDWLKLLDAVRRRVARRKLRPEETHRVKTSIQENYPEADC